MDDARIIEQIEKLCASLKHYTQEDDPLSKAVVEPLKHGIRQLAELLNTEECTDTTSHTRAICGNPRCRAT